MRSLALPLSRYPELTGFTEANDAYVQVAVELGEQDGAIGARKRQTSLRDEVDAIVMVSSTGVGEQLTVDARLASRIGFRPDVKRIPLFGLGCVAGAAGMARVHDYLRGFPGHVAVLLSVELCSLTLQRDDTSIPALIGVCLFGHGAAAVVAAGPDRVPLLSHRPSRAGRACHEEPTVSVPSYVMGWNVTSEGFGLVMSRDVPTARTATIPPGEEVARFLGDHGLTTDDILTWIGHPSYRFKVIDAIDHALGLPPSANAHSRDSLRENGNFSSASVLDVLHRTLATTATGRLAWRDCSRWGRGSASSCSS